jgi:hypothetical protein
VAQQYLPDALQGRVFYQPSDQGHEHSIRDQVARQREAQLSAMVESQGPLEVLTYTAGDRSHDRWLQRTIGNAGERLGRVRDRVLDAARLQRHHVVLDLNAGSGPLTGEILRRAPEGGTWALARDRQAGEGLRQQAERLPELRRPAVLVGDRGLQPCSGRYAFVWDLGEEWSRWTGLPFVFAMWIARPGVNGRQLEAALSAARDQGVAHLGEIARREAPALNLPEEDCLAYLRHLEFRLGERERQGLALFYQLAQRHGLAPPGVEIVFSDSKAPR